MHQEAAQRAGIGQRVHRGAAQKIERQEICEQGPVEQVDGGRPRRYISTARVLISREHVRSTEVLPEGLRLCGAIGQRRSIP